MTWHPSTIRWLIAILVVSLILLAINLPTTPEKPSPSGTPENQALGQGPAQQQQPPYEKSRCPTGAPTMNTPAPHPAANAKPTNTKAGYKTNAATILFIRRIVETLLLRKSNLSCLFAHVQQKCPKRQQCRVVSVWVSPHSPNPAF